MAQLLMKHDIVDSPFLRRHIADNVEEIETILPEGAPLTVQIKRVSRHLFGAHLRSRLLGREVIVRAYDTDLFQALNRARRHLLQQIGDVRLERRALLRGGRRRR